MNTVSVSNLIDCAQRAGLATSRKSTLPVLENILIEFADGVVKLSGTNLDHYISTQCTADVNEPFKTTVCAKKLLNIAKSLDKSGFVDIGMNGNSLVMKSKESTFKLPTIAADEFQVMYRKEHDHIGDFEVKTLLKAIKAVAHAQSKDETRYVMNGTQLEFGETEMHVVATDGRRLSFVRQEHKSDKQLAVILPLNAAAILASYDDHSNCTLYANERMLTAVFDAHDYFITKLVTGKFPDWRQVNCPKRTCPMVSVNTERLRNEARRASLICDEQHEAITLSVTNGEIKLEAETTEGKSECRLECEYEGPDVTIAVNSRYLADVLGQCDEQCKLLITDALDPIYVYSGNLSEIVMPLRK